MQGENELFPSLINYFFIILALLQIQNSLRTFCCKNPLDFISNIWLGLWWWQQWRLWQPLRFARAGPQCKNGC
jgi:hypothetical protein